MLHIPHLLVPAWSLLAPVDAALEHAARATGLPVPLVRAIAETESSLDPLARAAAGDSGLWQLHPGTARSFKLDIRALHCASELTSTRKAATGWIRAQLPACLTSQVEAFAAVMAEKLSTGGCDFSCYHSTTPEIRRAYRARVLRKLNLHRSR